MSIQFGIISRVGAHIHIAANISGHARIDLGITRIIAQTNGLGRAEATISFTRIRVGAGRDEGDGGRGHHADGDKGCSERTGRFDPLSQRYVLQPFHLMPHRFMLLK